MYIASLPVVGSRCVGMASTCAPPVDRILWGITGYWVDALHGLPTRSCVARPLTKFLEVAVTTLTSVAELDV